MPARRHRHQEFLKFLKAIDGRSPRTCEVHLILDNYATHTHADVGQLAGAHHPRFHLHFTPTVVVAQPRRTLVRHHHQQADPPRHPQNASSELNATSAPRSHWNRNPRPFVDQTADEILDKARPYLQRIPGAGPEAPFIWTKPADEIMTKIKRNKAQ